MNELLIEDEPHVIQYFKQLNIPAIQRAYSTFSRKPKKSGKEDKQEEDEREEDNWQSNMRRWQKDGIIQPEGIKKTGSSTNIDVTDHRRSTADQEGNRKTGLSNKTTDPNAK